MIPFCQHKCVDGATVRPTFCHETVSSNNSRPATYRGGVRRRLRPHLLLGVHAGRLVREDVAALQAVLELGLQAPDENSSPSVGTMATQVQPSQQARSATHRHLRGCNYYQNNMINTHRQIQSAQETPK